jgi:hypothetical protein
MSTRLRISSFHRGWRLTRSKDRNTGTGVFLINPDRITDLEDCARPLTIWRDHSPEQLFVADASSAVCLRPDPIPDADGDCLKFPGDCLKFLVEFAKVSDYADDEIMPGFVIGREVSRVGLEI